MERRLNLNNLNLNTILIVSPLRYYLLVSATYVDVRSSSTIVSSLCSLLEYARLGLNFKRKFGSYAFGLIISLVTCLVFHPKNNENIGFHGVFHLTLTI